MTGRLIIRNPSEYNNIGSLNIHKLKMNQHLALTNCHMPQRSQTTCVPPKKKKLLLLQKYVYLAFMHLYLLLILHFNMYCIFTNIL